MSTAKKSTTANKAIVNINLSAFEKKLSTITVKEKATKETIYNYPENFTPKMIGEKEGKQFRNKLRNKLRFFENNIFVAAKQKDNEKLISLTKEFNIHYKENYRVNDYSLKSVSQSQDELKTGDIEMMLNIVKAVNASISPEKKEKKAIVKADNKQPKTVKKTAKKAIVNDANIKTNESIIDG